MPDYRALLGGENFWGIAPGPWEPGHTKAVGTEATWNRSSPELDFALLQLKAAA